MRHASLSDFRANIASHLDELEQNRDHLLVTRQGHESVVVLPLSEWEGLEATLHLLSTQANRDMPARSIAQGSAGNVIEGDTKNLLHKTSL